MPLTSLPPGAAYGWRARIALMQPTGIAENNPYEFYLMAPPGVTLVTTSYGFRQPEPPPGADPMIAGIEDAIERLQARDVDAFIQAAVPTTASRGWGFDDKIMEHVTKITDRPFVTDLGSCIKAMQTVGLTRPAMLSAFNESDHANIEAYVKNAGIAIAGAKTLRVNPAEYEKLSYTSLETIYRAAKQVFRAASNPDGIWITGALMPSVGAVQSLEDDLGVPVVTSMQSMAWAALRAVSVNEKIEGFGRLFQSA